MAQQSNTLVSEPGELSSTPETHTLERTDPHTLFPDFHMYAGACAVFLHRKQNNLKVSTTHADRKL